MQTGCFSPVLVLTSELRQVMHCAACSLVTGLSLAALTSARWIRQLDLPPCPPTQTHILTHQVSLFVCCHLVKKH